MNTANAFQKVIERSKERERFWVETAILEFTEEMAARMEELGVTNSQMADRLKVNPAYVTKLLRGNNNFTIETMVKISRALDSELRVHLQPGGTVSQWVNVVFNGDSPTHSLPETDWNRGEFTPIILQAGTPDHEPFLATA
jgi:plasmid maintenance system antidote protein VapI